MFLQCALDQVKEGVTATMFMKLNGQKLAIGTLSVMTSKFQFYLVFEKEFELSHNSKSSSGCFTTFIVLNMRNISLHQIVLDADPIPDTQQNMSQTTAIWVVLNLKETRLVCKTIFRKSIILFWEICYLIS